LADSRAKGTQIEVTTNHGIVALGGFVATAAEKDTAATLAAKVDGVARVDNGIRLAQR
jgi:hyperosmotically inducible protein